MLRKTPTPPNTPPIALSTNLVCPDARGIDHVTLPQRAIDLLAIAAALQGGQTTAIGQAATVHGLGGVDKTTVATEFVHRYGAYFAGGVFWRSFADPANVPVEIAQCGGEGHLQLRPDFHELPLEERVAAVQRAWQEDIDRLLVFDNVDTDEAEALVKPYCPPGGGYRPPSGGCRVLITSRRGAWDASLGTPCPPISPPSVPPWAHCSWSATRLSLSRPGWLPMPSICSATPGFMRESWPATTSASHPTSLPSPTNCAAPRGWRRWAASSTWAS